MVLNGSYVQLSAIGPQDRYLTGNPSFSYFKSVYRRHTPFVFETSKVEIGKVQTDVEMKVNIQKSGDMIKGLMLEIQLPSLSCTLGGAVQWVDKVGHAAVEYIKLEINGVEIDKHYGEWLELWNQLTSPSLNKDTAYDNMIGNIPLMTGFTTTKAARTIYVPLQFWFCRYLSSALPIAAIKNGDIKLKIKFRNINDLIIPRAGDTVDSVVKGEITAQLLVDYVLLAPEERRRLCQKPQMQLMEQVQFNQLSTVSTQTAKLFLNLYFPVKETVMVIQRQSAVTNKTYFDYGPVGVTTDFETALLNTMTISLNGVEKTTNFSAEYYGLVQPYKYHTRVPDSVGIYNYSFSLYPEKFQPSGTCNFSMMDNAELQLTFTANPIADPLNIRLYAPSYNFILIKNGVLSVVYVN